MANPFDDDFSSSSKNRGAVKSYTISNNIEDEANAYEREIERYMQESLDSTERSKRHLENSEQLGAKTALDLLEQREKLEKTEQNLDNIHHTTQMTQRNLNSLKSVFGGFFKNKFSKKPQDPTVAAASMPTSKSATGLSNTLDQISNNPAMGTSGQGQATLSDSSRAAIKGTRWEEMDRQIDQNLDGMSANLQNLRGLGEALGKEVEDQNKMLDRIHMKAERNDGVVRSQDKQMQKLLGAVDAKEEAGSMAPSMDTSTKLSWAMKATSLFK